MRNTKNPQNTAFAQQLRREMTDEEQKLWHKFFSRLPLTVHRQKVIGSYVADFYIAQSHLIIEVDGAAHYTPPGHHHDEIRTQYFQSLGLTVLRYSNSDIHRRFHQVCEDIYQHIIKGQF